MVTWPLKDRKSLPRSGPAMGPEPRAQRPVPHLGCVLSRGRWLMPAGHWLRMAQAKWTVGRGAPAHPHWTRVLAGQGLC